MHPGSLQTSLFTVGLLCLCGLCLAADPASTPTAPMAKGIAQGEFIDSSHLVDTVVGLALVLALMLGLAWLVKRYLRAPGMGRGHVQVVGGVSLGPRERAVLVKVEGRRLLLGVAPGRVQTLMVLDREPPYGQESDQAELAQQLATAGSQLDAEGRE